MNQALAARLREAAEFLEADIPPGTPVIQDLDGDVRLDALDLYCVNLMIQAAEVLSTGPDLLEALKGLLGANDAVQLALCDEPWMEGAVKALRDAQAAQTVAEEVARAAQAKAEGRQ